MSAHGFYAYVTTISSEHFLIPWEKSGDGGEKSNKTMIWKSGIAKTEIMFESVDRLVEPTNICSWKSTKKQRFPAGKYGHEQKTVITCTYQILTQ